jgi:Rrf2 family protein
MLISTRGRYAIRVIIDLAQNSNGNFIPMKDVAKRQEISLKYLEKILPILTKHKIVEGVHGKGGGYKLGKNINKYKVIDILKLTEGDLAPVTCLKKGEHCKRKSHCKTVFMWNKFYDIINKFFSSITIDDLLNDNKNFDLFTNIQQLL